MWNRIQCPLDIATLDIAAALSIATSTPVTEASRYIQCALYSSMIFRRGQSFGLWRQQMRTKCGRTQRPHGQSTRSSCPWGAANRQNCMRSRFQVWALTQSYYSILKRNYQAGSPTSLSKTTFYCQGYSLACNIGPVNPSFIIDMSIQNAVD